jgi:hypothetical protein
MKQLIGGGGGGVGEPGPAGSVSAAGSGTAAAPGIAFASDTNTGIYNPGADQLAVATNGTGRLFIDASGNIVINGSASSGGFAFSQIVPVSGSPVNSFRVTNGSDATYDVKLQSGLATIGAGVGSLAFITNDVERIRLDTSGRVGIGTTSPGYLVTAATSADGIDGISVESPSVNGVIRLRADGTNGNAIRVGGVGAQGNTLRFLAGSDAERMRIDSSGRLLVGTSSASAGTQETTSIVGSTLSQSTGLQSVAGSGTLDLNLSTANALVGHLYVSACLAANAAARTVAIYFVTTRLGAGTTITSLNSANGPSGSITFTITNPSGNIFRFTDTSTGATTVSLSFVGNMGA